MLENNIRAITRAIFTILILLSLAGCFGSNGGEDNHFDAWFGDINPSPSSIVETSIVQITGEASCPGCPRMTDWMLNCPILDCPESTNISITWTNTTTGESGATDQRVVRSCIQFFGWCACECVHRWSASVPLALGVNEIVITATEPTIGSDQFTMTLTRLLERPGNVVAEANTENFQIALSWDSVPEAVSYDLYWSTKKTITTDTANKIIGVASPYTVWGSPDTPHYFLIKAVNGEHESNPSDLIWAVTGWITETVVETDVWGVNTSIAVDSLGDSHIHYSTSYWDEVNYYDNYYTTRQTGNWITTSIGDPSTRNSDIAVDSSDIVHISYIESSGLTHSIYSSNVWVADVVDPKAYDNATLAIDSQDNAHLVYREGDPSLYDLKYANNISGSWVSTTLDTISNFNSPVERHIQTGRWVSLDVESDGTAHIAYEGSTTESGLRYATNQGGAWSYLTIDSDNIQQLSLAVDSNGKAHVIYSDDLGQLRYAHNTAGVWSAVQIETETRSYYPTLALDAAGNAHIIYFNTLHDEVRYATNTFGEWRIIPLDTVGDVDTAHGLRTDIAVDSNNKVYLSYIHRNTSLKFSTNR